METLETIRADQLETFAHFLEEHPSFSPLLFGEDALVCGFQVGQCLLCTDECQAGKVLVDPRSALLSIQRNL